MKHSADAGATAGAAIYLCAPVNALVEGIYEQKVPLARVLQHGDFGLGTFDSLDGEMVILDGRVYQIPVDGKVVEVDPSVATPFAAVTFFKPISYDDIDGPMPHARFMRWLDRLLPSPNLFYAVRLEGEFERIRARSVPKQANYRPLAEVARDQAVFEFGPVRGTLAGFYTPSFMSSLSVPGLHLHFVSEDRRHGGHVLECAPCRVRAGIQFIRTLELSLPMTADYLSMDFRRPVDRDLQTIEK
jgi:acetolactate decarboxylase